MKKTTSFEENHNEMRRLWAFPSERIQTCSGHGDWEAFNASPYTIHDIIEAGKQWHEKLASYENLWLCWNVDPEWCLVQQALVLSAGWTPLVGWDPRCGTAPLLPGAIAIDFNAPFGFTAMYPHFVIEFAFTFAKRLAFWHSDLLVSPNQFRRYANHFKSLTDGKIVATMENHSTLAKLVGKHPRRAWELLGCVTKSASRELFDKGIWLVDVLLSSPDAFWPQRADETDYPLLGSRTGILYWARYAGGQLDLIPEREIQDGHFTRIGREAVYKVYGGSGWRRNLTKDLPQNFSLKDACDRKGLNKEYEIAIHYMSQQNMSEKSQD